jgi:3-deoxy-manno-octulosonate cytidylyltransferase (CMP-KDO synthetase)
MLGIIPARYASSRFPGKPLALILGRPMVAHVYERARRCPELDRVVLATDDDRIRDAAHELGIPVVMTSPEHPSGSDRVLEAALALGATDEHVVVNIQGDEPALDPAMLSELVAPFNGPEGAAVRVATLATDLPPDQADNPDRVKVVLARDGNALYFSRAPIPFGRDGTHREHRLHLGLYAFRLEALRRFAALPRGRLEALEQLEQLRFLENGIPVRVSLTRHVSQGVDRPEDLETVTKIIMESTL